MSVIQPKDFTEELLAKLVGIYLKHLGWDVYPEVVLSWFSGRPDYVCAKDSLVMAVECKKTLSYEVIEQLYRWREVEVVADNAKSLKGIPHLLYAAAFSKRASNISGLKSQLLKSNRMGYIAVVYERESTNISPNLHISNDFGDQINIDMDGHRWLIRNIIPAKLQPGSRATAHRIFSQLNEDMKRAVSGLSGAIGCNYSIMSSSYLSSECHLQKAA